MKRFIMIAVMVIAQITQVAFFSVPAFASRGDAVNLSTIRHESSIRSKLVRIEGALSCEMAAINSGAGCSLRILDNKSGQTFNLIEANNAMRLYQDGNTKVAIEGTMSDSQTIQVRKAEIL